MTITEAIEIVKADLMRPGSVEKLIFQDAEQLLIEAGKRHQNRASTTWHKMMEPLPGETEE